MVQRYTDGEGGEVDPAQMWDIFAREYLVDHQPSTRARGRQLRGVHCGGQGRDRSPTAYARRRRPRTLTGVGNGPIDAFIHALSDVDIEVRVLDYAEHAMSAGGDAQAAAYVEAEVDGEVCWGVGVDPNIVTASLRAVAAAVNRAARWPLDRGPVAAIYGAP